MLERMGGETFLLFNHFGCLQKKISSFFYLLAGFETGHFIEQRCNCIGFFEYQGRFKAFKPHSYSLSTLRAALS